MRAHLLRSFLGAYIVLTILAGAASYQLLHSFLRQQAESSARSLAGVLTAGGFTFSESIQQRMAELTGYEFEIVAAGDDSSKANPASTVRASFPGGVLVVYYQTAAYQRALRTVLIFTMAIACLGIALFAIVAWRIAKNFAQPLEQLAAAAMAIGRGDWQQPVPTVGKNEVQRLALDLETMRQQLLSLDHRHRNAERLATLGTFTATIAHEVRNPLSAIRLSIQLLRGQYPEQSSLTLIEEEIERLDDIVDELLGYSRGMNVELEVCQLDQVAHNVKRLLSRQSQHAGVEVEVLGSGSFMADPRRMRQLLLNLLLNAIQALHGSEEDGLVTIRITDDGLQVEDNGPGVSAERIDDLFTAFATSRSAGTGLGLHLAHLIAQAHHAELRYSAHVPHGSRFSLSGLQRP